MITVACVLKSGGDFKPEHVWRLKRATRKHLHEPHEFSVLTDVDFAGWLGHKLVERLPGWWAKMELFRPGLFEGLVMYFDLDTLIVGSLDDLAGYSGAFAMIADFYKPRFFQSGMMIFRPGLQTSEVYTDFMRDPERHMHGFRGDGQYLNAHVDAPDRLQDLYPGQIISYKRDVQQTGIVPAAARVLCFHGQPRPWKTPLWEEFNP